MEITDVIQKCRSKHPVAVDQILNSLFEHMFKIIDIPPLPKKRTRRAKSITVEEPSKKNENEVKFSSDVICYHRPPLDLSMLNLKHPCHDNYFHDIILFKPEHGKTFYDFDGKNN